jgi:HlyD family secretion protein
MFSTRGLFILGMGILLLGTAALLLWPRGATSIVRTGQVEVREIDIASKIPGRVEWIHVREGDKVAAGDALFKLTDREVRARVAQAEGARDAARAQFDMAASGTRREQIAMAENNFTAAASQFDLAERTLRRMKGLHQDGLLSDQELDVVEQKYRAAKAAMDAAAAQRDMARNGARREERAMAHGNFSRANSTVDEARSYLDESVLRAPIAGVIAKRYNDVGEMVSAGYPVLTLLDLDDTWIELNVPESELRLLHLGSTVRAEVPALGDIITLRVSNIAAMADYANWRAQDERGSFELRSFTVTLRPVRPIAGLRPGMTVRVRFGGDAR